ncbi:hypothetical protein LTR53_003345 [Teratosphaeriaceae sp. CCFEE 6253]|nr:hypothetical protein LTR53_003345 [Teratosphaeriaceae sp. CCFEE 6253]
MNRSTKLETPPKSERSLRLELLRIAKRQEKRDLDDLESEILFLLELAGNARARAALYYYKFVKLTYVFAPNGYSLDDRLIAAEFGVRSYTEEIGAIEEETFI